jgi:hypothetical protein
VKLFQGSLKVKDNVGKCTGGQFVVHLQLVRLGGVTGAVGKRSQRYSENAGEERQ